MESPISEIELKEISQLVYLDIVGEKGKKDSDDLSNLYINNRKQIKLRDLIDYYQSPEGQDKIRERFPNTINGTNEYDQWMNLLNNLEKTDRINWTISDVESNNGKNESGFVAFTVETSPGTKVVAFRGSEPINDPQYRNDWHNNGTTSYELESLQQKEAREYIERLARDSKLNELYFTGHSLGGNLALYASFNLSPELREKLITTSTFNAPGFNSDVINKYQSVIDELNSKGKLNEFRNRNDAVPALFNNPSKGIYIDTLAEGDTSFDHHSMFSLDLEQDKNGNWQFKRSEIQEGDTFPQIVQNFTVGLDFVPNFLKEALIREGFKIWGGQIEIQHFLFAAAAVAMIVIAGPIPVLAGALRIVLSVYVLGFIKNTLIPWIKEGIQNIAEGIKAFVKEGIAFITNMVDSAIKAANLIGSQVLKFQQQVKSAVTNFFNKMEEGLKRFTANTIAYVKAKVDYWISVKDKAAKKIGDIFESVKSKFKQKKDEFVSGVRAFKDKLIGNIKAKITKTVKTVIAATANVVRSAKILANLNRLEGLYTNLLRQEERISERVNRILNVANGVVSNVGRSYSESYVQAQLRQLDSICNQVKAEKRRVEEILHSKATGLKYSITKYREIEAALARAARMALTPM